LMVYLLTSLLQTLHRTFSIIRAVFRQKKEKQLFVCHLIGGLLLCNLFEQNKIGKFQHP